MSLANVIQRSKVERESWRYTDIEKLLAKPRAEVAKPSNDVAAQGPRFVFKDGLLRKEQSELRGLPADMLQGDAGSYVLSVQKDTCLITQPLELLFISSGSKEECATKLKIELGESARLTLLERHEGADAVHVLETEITLAKQAKLVHGKILSGRSGAHLSNAKIRVDEGAYYDRFDLLKGGSLVRNEIDAVLAGKLAQCALNGAMLAKGHDHLDTTTRITHAAPFGTSREFYKSVLADSSRAVFQGKILVKPDAQKTDGHQLSRALLLSDQAEMDAKPELEIYADDVKCSHGSTVGDLDDASMFYLQARGIPEAEARGLLIEAFVGEILDEIHAAEVREACRLQLEGWLQ